MDKDDKVTFGSGAQSSITQACFDEIPPELEKRIAARYLKGHRYGRGNWLRGLQPGNIDVDFLRDRYNHAREHLNAMRQDIDDDNIGAIGWFLGFATVVESMGISWYEVLRPRTPEDEKRWRKELNKKTKERK